MSVGFPMNAATADERQTLAWHMPAMLSNPITATLFDVHAEIQYLSPANSRIAASRTVAG
jgi:hypothetical protein